MKYILKHENDYVKGVEGTPWETVKMYFTWTKKRAEARRFSLDEIFPHQATTSIGSEFTRGFSGGRLIRISEI